MVENSAAAAVKFTLYLRNISCCCCVSAAATAAFGTAVVVVVVLLLFSSAGNEFRPVSSSCTVRADITGGR